MDTKGLANFDVQCDAKYHGTCQLRERVSHVHPCAQDLVSTISTTMSTSPSGVTITNAKMTDMGAQARAADVSHSLWEQSHTSSPLSCPPAVQTRGTHDTSAMSTAEDIQSAVSSLGAYHD